MLPSTAAPRILLPISDAGAILGRVVKAATRESLPRALALLREAITETAYVGMQQVWYYLTTELVNAQTVHDLDPTSGPACQTGFVRQLHFAAWWVDAGYPVCKQLRDGSAVSTLSLRQLLNQVYSGASVWTGIRTLMLKVRRVIMQNFVSVLSVLTRAPVTTGGAPTLEAADSSTSNCQDDFLAALRARAEANAWCVDADCRARPCKDLPQYIKCLRIIGYEAPSAMDAMHALLKTTFRACYIDLVVAVEDHLRACVTDLDRAAAKRLAACVVNPSVAWVFEHSWRVVQD
jgi:hypothetical protein